MRMQFDRAALQRELQAVQSVAGKTKTTIPASQHVLMERSPEGCTISATDMQIATRSLCPMTQADIIDGQVLLPAHKLYEIVQALPTGADVVIDYDDKGARITCGGFTSRLNVLPTSEFPTLPTTPDEPGMIIPRAVLREMVRKTKFSVSAEDTRFYLAGGQLSTNGEELRMVTTDGHRLAIVIAPLVAEASTAIIPTSTMRELASMLDGDGPDVTYKRGENHLFFQAGTRLLISRQIDGTFPSWEKIVPKNNANVAKIKREPLQEAIQRVAIMADMRSKAVKLTLEGPRVVIDCQSVDNGEASDSVDQEYAGETLTMAFNARYLLDFLAATEGDMISLALKDTVSQAVMKTIGSDGYDYTYVIMPMRA